MQNKNQLIKLIQENKLNEAIIIDCDDVKELSSVSNDLLQVLICPNNSFPCDYCLICSRFKKNLLTNVWTLKSDKQSIKKEILKDYMRQLSLFNLEQNLPKIFIIELIEDLTLGAANSLLKFLEEPPSNTFIILLSINYWDVLSTIRSRCARYHLISTKKADESKLEKIIKADNEREFITLSWQWSKLPKKELISDLQQTYHDLIVPYYPQLISATLSVLNDLNHFAFDYLAINNYLINLQSLIRNANENL